jgi:hypothetical protein
VLYLLIRARWEEAGVLCWGFRFKTGLAMMLMRLLFFQGKVVAKLHYVQFLI